MPDRTVAAMAAARPHCDHALSPQDRPNVHAHHVDLPPVRPVVRRVHRHGGTRPRCRRASSAPAPEGSGPGSPFGPGTSRPLAEAAVSRKTFGDLAPDCQFHLQVRFDHDILQAFDLDGRRSRVAETGTGLFGQ